MLLLSLPFLFLKGRCLLSVFCLILELKNLLTEVLHLPRELSHLSFIFLSHFIARVMRLNFLLLDILNKLALLFVLLVCLLGQVFNLLHEEGLLLVEL